MLVSAVIARALRLLGVVDASMPVPPNDAQTAIIALNAMCNRWEADGTALGWANVGITDTMPSPDEAEEAIVYNLAVRLAPEYGMEPRQIVSGMAMQFKEDLLRDRLNEMPLRMRSDLDGSSGYNVYTDERA